MAWSNPALTKAVAPANGTNNFALSNPTSQGPYRTDVQAVADGSLTDGTSVHYGAWRTTTTGDAEFEEGYGTYTSATRTIARTAGNVLDGSGGPGVLVDFGLSGQMDILFYPVLDGSDVPVPDDFCDNIGAARTNAANTFVEGQTISKAGGTDFKALVAENTSTGSTSNEVVWRARIKSGTGVQRNAFQIRSTLSDVTNGAEVTSVFFATQQSGVFTTAFKVVGGELQDSSGNPYDAFPSGQELTTWTTPPTGWVRVNVTGQRIPRLAESGDTLSSTGGSWTISGLTTTVNGHILTSSEIPSHSHTIPGWSGSGGSGVGFLRVSDGDTEVDPTETTNTTGSGGSHSHTASTSSSGAWRPAYKICCIMQKS